MQRSDEEIYEEQERRRIKARRELEKKETKAADHFSGSDVYRFFSGIASYCNAGA